MKKNIIEHGDTFLDQSAKIVSVVARDVTLSLS